MSPYEKCTFQNSIEEAKKLVECILELMKLSLKPDDIFYYAEFISHDIVKETIENGYAGDIDDEYEREQFNIEFAGVCEGIAAYEIKWLVKVEDIMLQISKGEIERPRWINLEDSDEVFDTKLYLFPKMEEFKKLSRKLIAFLNSPHRGYN